MKRQTLREVRHEIGGGNCSSFCTPGIADAFGAQTQSPQEQVRSAIADMNKAAASLDADRFMTWYWNSPSLAITFDGQTMRGWQSILEQKRKWWSDKNSGVQFTEQRPPDIVMQGADVASSIQWMTIGSTAESAKPAQLVITSVWKKRAGGSFSPTSPSFPEQIRLPRASITQ